MVTFDFDNDGDKDIFIANNSEVSVVEGITVRAPGIPVLLRNDSVNSNNSISVHLAGTTAPHHSHGIGSRVYTTAGGVTRMRELNASSGFNGHGPERIAHFGVGTATQCDVVRAVWTNGDETELHDVPVSTNTSVTLTSPSATVSSRTLNLNDTVTASTNLLPGETLQWLIAGVIDSNANPVNFGFSSPGTYQLRLTIMNNGVFVRAETLTITVLDPDFDEGNIARQWNEQNLRAIRLDFPNPPVHGRNLFHVSLAMWDAWAAFDPQAVGVLHNETATGGAAARDEAISYAAYRVLVNRYSGSVNGSTTLATFNLLMEDLDMIRTTPSPPGPQAPQWATGSPRRSCYTPRMMAGTISKDSRRALRRRQ